MYSRVPECQITTYYYVGFAYLMMRRYQDAIRVFANILLYIQRTRNMFQRSTYKYEMVSVLNCYLVARLVDLTRELIHFNPCKQDGQNQFAISVSVVISIAPETFQIKFS